MAAQEAAKQTMEEMKTDKEAEVAHEEAISKALQPFVEAESKQKEKWAAFRVVFRLLWAYTFAIVGSCIQMKLQFWFDAATSSPPSLPCPGSSTDGGNVAAQQQQIQQQQQQPLSWLWGFAVVLAVTTQTNTMLMTTDLWKSVRFFVCKLLVWVGLKKPGGERPRLALHDVDTKVEQAGAGGGAGGTTGAASNRSKKKEKQAKKQRKRAAKEMTETGQHVSIRD